MKPLSLLLSYGILKPVRTDRRETLNGFPNRRHLKTYATLLRATRNFLLTFAHAELNSFSTGTLFNSYYNEAKRKYPNKPQMFWELASLRGTQQGQPKWVDEALNDIKTTYSKWIKGVMLDETFDPGAGDALGSADPTPTVETIEVVRNHFSSGYFIASMIK